ncbi:hypothetical protein [Oryzifoliimicrobium ureilyticus]|uniref:hypothetical protein n=1 Tax=Oryzifoliimicrobium ureilyticus TaxID=3113724 RepID=UPI0030764C19
MRVQILIIVSLLSALSWLVAFDSSRDLYRMAHEAGVIPNLHIKHHLRDVL